MFLQSTASEQKLAIQRFYDRLSPHFQRLWGPHLHDGLYLTGDETREVAQQQLVEFLAERAEIPRGSHVLDVGCGMGATSVWLAEKQGCRATGITLSPIQVEMATSLAQKRGVDAEFHLMDAEKIAFDHPFDAVWMVGVLGHLPDQGRFVRQAHRLLKPNGRFLLADWTVAEGVSSRDYQSIVLPTIHGMMMPEIVPASSYLRWFKESGFRIVRSLDITEQTRKTWDDGIRIVQAPAVLRLALELGTDAIDLLSAIHQMRKAMKRGLIRYSVVVAERG